MQIDLLYLREQPLKPLSSIFLFAAVSCAGAVNMSNAQSVVHIGIENVIMSPTTLTGGYFSLGKHIDQTTYSNAFSFHYMAGHTHQRYGHIIGKPRIKCLQIGMEPALLILNRPKTKRSLSILADICYSLIELEDEHVPIATHYTSHGAVTNYLTLGMSQNLLIGPRLSYVSNRLNYMIGYNFLLGKAGFASRTALQGLVLTIGIGMN